MVRRPELVDSRTDGAPLEARVRRELGRTVLRTLSARLRNPNTGQTGRGGIVGDVQRASERVGGGAL